MRLDAHLVERFRKSTNCVVRILTIEEVNLFECAAIGFYACKASHLDDHGCDALELIFAWLKFPVGLIHVAIDETELDFTVCHICLDLIRILL